MTTTAAPMTVEEFLKLPDIEEQRLELIRGEVVDIGSGAPPHEIVKCNLNRVLQSWLLDHPEFELFAESMYYLDDRTSLIPDLSLLRAERMKRGPEDLFRGAPDIAIEIVSSEPANRLATKIDLYLMHGANLVLVIYPERRRLEIHSANGLVRKLSQDQSLEDLDVLPGFSTPVHAFFKWL